jgi:hypothetical protein
MMFCDVVGSSLQGTINISQLHGHLLNMRSAHNIVDSNQTLIISGALSYYSFCFCNQPIAIITPTLKATSTSMEETNRSPNLP